MLVQRNFKRPSTMPFSLTSPIELEPSLPRGVPPLRRMPGTCLFIPNVRGVGVPTLLLHVIVPLLHSGGILPTRFPPIISHQTRLVHLSHIGRLRVRRVHPSLHGRNHPLCPAYSATRADRKATMRRAVALALRWCGLRHHNSADHRARL